MARCLQLLGEARAELQNLKRLVPEITLAWVRDVIPYVREEDRKKYLEGFLLSGLELSR